MEDITQVLRLELDAARAIKTQEELKASIKTTRDELEKTDKTTDGYAKLEARLTALKSELKRLTDATKENENALGGINRSAKFVEGSYGELLQRKKALRSELLNLKIGSEAYIQTEEELNSVLAEEIELRKAQPSLFKERIKQAIEETDTLKSLKLELRNYMTEAAKAGETTPIGREFLAKAGEVKNRIDDIRGATKALAGDNVALDTTIQSFKLAGGVFAGVQGTIGLLGRENQNLEKTLVKIQGSMAVLNALTEVQNALGAESLVRIKGTALAQRAWTLAVGESSGALKILRVALAATGIGLLVAGIVLLITNFKQVKEAVVGFVDSLGPVGSVIKALAAPFILVYDLLRSVGEALGFVQSQAANLAEEDLARNARVLSLVSDRYDREIKLAQATGKETIALEQQKLIASTDILRKQLANLETLRRENRGLNEEQLNQVRDLKKQILDNEAELTAGLLKEKAKREEESRKVSEQLADAEVKRLSALGRSTIPAQIRLLDIQYKNSVEAARKKGEDISGIEAKYEADRLALIAQSREQERKLQADLDKAKAALISSSREREKEEIRLSFQERLAQIKGSSRQEIELRKVLKVQEAEALKLIDLKYSREAEEFRTSTLIDLARKGSIQELNLRLSALSQARDKEVAEAEKTGKDVLLVRSKYKKLEDDLLRGFDQSAENSARAQRIADLSSEISLRQSIEDGYFTQKQERAALAYESDLANLKAQLDANLLTDSEYYTAKKNLETEYLRTASDLSQEELDRQVEYNNRKAELASTIAQGLSDLFNIFNADAAASASFQKAMAVFQIGVDTARAISGVVAAAASTSLTPIDMGLKIATGIGTVIANIAKAKQLLTAPPPKAPNFYSGGRTDDISPRTFSPIGSGYSPLRIVSGGGQTDTGPRLAWINERGPEWISPNWMLKDPISGPVIAALERYRTGGFLGFADGGFTASYVSSPAESRENTGLVVAEALRRMPRPVVDVVTILDKADEVNEVEASSKVFN